MRYKALFAAATLGAFVGGALGTYSVDAWRTKDTNMGKQWYEEFVSVHDESAVNNHLVNIQLILQDRKNLALEWNCWHLRSILLRYQPDVETSTEPSEYQVKLVSRAKKVVQRLKKEGQCNLIGSVEGLSGEAKAASPERERGL